MRFTFRHVAEPVSRYPDTHQVFLFLSIFFFSAVVLTEVHLFIQWSSVAYKQDVSLLPFSPATLNRFECR